MTEIKELTKLDKIVIKYYGKKTSNEICELADISLPKFRGVASRLSKLGEIVTPNKTKKPKKETNTFTNFDGVNKTFGRNLLADRIKETGIIGRVLTLPYSSCIFELLLLDKISKDFTFVGCEHNPDTYYEMLKTVIKHKINMACIPNDLIETVKRSKEGDYAHIFADYCGQFDTYAEDIKLILKKKPIQVGGIFAFTVSNRKANKDSIIDEMNKLEPIGVRDGNLVEHGIRTFLTKYAKNNFATLVSYPYKDDEKQAMLLVIMQRVK